MQPNLNNSPLPNINNSIYNPSANRKLVSHVNFLAIGFIALLVVFYFSANHLSTQLMTEWIFSGGISSLLGGLKLMLPAEINFLLFSLAIYIVHQDASKIFGSFIMGTLVYFAASYLTFLHILDFHSFIIAYIVLIGIVIVLLDNLFTQKFKGYRLGSISGFNIVYGILMTKLLMENNSNISMTTGSFLNIQMGIIIGQLLLTGLFYVIIKKLGSSLVHYREKVVMPVSLLLLLAVGVQVYRLLIL